MTIGAAIRMLEREYKKARLLEWVHNPLAYALYQVWKEADGQRSEAETQKPRTRHRPDYSAFDTEKMADEAREWHRQNKLFGKTEQLKGGEG